ncbi:hypothetical protein V865_008006 [Kwoniella europaea PYCC6329]|uniref:C2H2-type domain-containing protein n=1 Tax=Kwoniella europaea PYCC6329 TaxID=1423913 RepID=A0AAX4KVQ3_9TREE
MSSAKHKFCCGFWNCTRGFDRWSRLEKHFRDHINNDVRYRPPQRSSASTSTMPPSRRRRNKTIPRRRSKKNRTSNDRDHIPAITSARNINPMTIDIRTPSLSPDTPSEAESEMEVDIVEPVQEAQTPPTTTPSKKGPRWAVAPPSPTPPRLVEEEEEEVVSEPENTDVAQGGTIMEDEINHSENGDIDQAEETISSPITTPLTPHRLPQPRPQDEDEVIESPIARLGTATPRAHRSHSQDSAIIITPRPRYRNKNKDSASRTADKIEADETLVILTPNSLDPFIRDAMSSIGLRRGRSETPCPMPTAENPVRIQGYDLALSGGSVPTPQALPKTTNLPVSDSVNNHAFNGNVHSSTPNHTLTPSSPRRSTVPNSPNVIVSTELFIEKLKQISNGPSDNQLLTQLRFSSQSSSDTMVNGSPFADVRSTVKRVVHLFEDIKENERKNRAKMAELGILIDTLGKLHGVDL